MEMLRGGQLNQIISLEITAYKIEGVAIESDSSASPTLVIF